MNARSSTASLQGMVFTLPVCIFLGSLLFSFANCLVLNWFGVK